MDSAAPIRKQTGPGKKPGKSRNRKQKDKNLRCFFGIAFRNAQVLAPLQQQLSSVAQPEDKLRLSPPENLHLTLSFLGSLPASRLDEAKVIGSAVCSRHGELSLNCRGAGAFKNSIWVGVSPDEALLALAEELRQSAVLLGMPVDPKPFQPHITVARFAPPARNRLLPVLEPFQTQEWLTFSASKASLYLSETLQEGARYSILKSFALGAAELPLDTPGTQSDDIPTESPADSQESPESLENLGSLDSLDSSASSTGDN